MWRGVLHKVRVGSLEPTHTRARRDACIHMYAHHSTHTSPRTYTHTHTSPRTYTHTHKSTYTHTPTQYPQGNSNERSQEDMVVSANRFGFSNVQKGLVGKRRRHEAGGSRPLCVLVRRPVKTTGFCLFIGSLSKDELEFTFRAR